ncbi:hypothetical protein VTO42DRAFT_6124 [Malbranchea cinnamomea]
MPGQGRGLKLSNCILQFFAFLMQLLSPIHILIFFFPSDPAPSSCLRPNLIALATEELARLARQKPDGKACQKERAKSMVVEFAHRFGSTSTDPRNWKVLCKEMVIHPVPTSIT